MRRPTCVRGAAMLAAGLGLALVVGCGSRGKPVAAGTAAGKGAGSGAGAGSAPGSGAASAAASKAPAKKTPAVEAAKAVTLQLPAGFSRADRDGLLIVRGPSATLRVAVAVLAGAAADVRAAVATAWQRLRPSYAAKPREIVKMPSSPRPYERSFVANYAPSAGRVRQAIVHHYKGRTYVLLLDGSIASVKKRAAQLREVFTSVRPHGAKLVKLSKADAIKLGSAQLDALEQLVREARGKLGVPGVALAIVQDGKVLRAFGAGTTRLGGKAKVTPKTQMMIGSITKSLTALMLAKLVAAGKLAWDTPVTKLYPGFKLASAKQTAALKMWHLMCACTGLPRRDLPLLFEFERATPMSVFRQLAKTKLLTGFGETFQYSNQMVAAAGFVAARALGRGSRRLGRLYRRLLRRVLLDPLGMRATTLLQSRVRRRRRFAHPHNEDIRGKVRTVPLSWEHVVDHVAPAGALWSSASDFAKLLVALTGGPGKDKLPPAEALRAVWRPRVKISAHAGYGLGWITSRWRGVKVLSHGGGTFGFISHFAYVPAANAGYVLLTNGMRGGALRAVFTRKWLSLLFKQRDRTDKRLAFYVERIAKSIAQLGKRVGDKVAPARARALVGTYRSPDLGRVRVLRRGGKLMLHTGKLMLQFLPWKPAGKPAHAEEYVIVDPPLSRIRFWVEQKAGGKPTLMFEPNSVRYTLSKVR